MGMRTKLFLAALMAAFVVASLGCNQGRRRGAGGGGGGGGGGTDAGPMDTDAGGGGGDVDSGGIVLMDSGPTPECSAGTPCPAGEMCADGVCVPALECSTNADCLSSEECVSGECVASTMSCPTDTITLAGVSCTSTTYNCVVDCGSDGVCMQACLDADADPNLCNGCVQNNILSCYNANGCQADWNCFSQCITDNSCTDRTCATTYCSAEDTAYSNCIDSLPSSVSCSSQFRACFP